MLISLRGCGLKRSTISAGQETDEIKEVNEGSSSCRALDIKASIYLLSLVHCKLGNYSSVLSLGMACSEWQGSTVSMPTGRQRRLDCYKGRVHSDLAM